MTSSKLARASWTLGLGLAVLAGCGGGGSGKQQTETDFCSQKADAECQVTDRCVSDKAACKAQRMARCMTFVADAKASGKRTFKTGNISACISKTMSTYAKTSGITPKDLADVDEACQYVFQGSGKVNIDHCDVKYDSARTRPLRQDVLRDGVVAEGRRHAVRQSRPRLRHRRLLRGEQAGVMVCVAKGAAGDACDGRQAVPRASAARPWAPAAIRVASAGSCVSNDYCAATRRTAIPPPATSATWVCRSRPAPTLRRLRRQQQHGHRRDGGGARAGPAARRRARRTGRHRGRHGRAAAPAPAGQLQTGSGTGGGGAEAAPVDSGAWAASAVSAVPSTRVWTRRRASVETHPAILCRPKSETAAPGPARGPAIRRVEHGQSHVLLSDRMRFVQCDAGKPRQPA